jgi:uncharacterized protein (DUF58 family)
MWTSFKKRISRKIESIGKVEQLYIVPTLDGLKLLALNLILLIIGLVYANNFVLLFNFILFCLFLGSMYYTHFNLQGLKLISAKLPPVHVNNKGLLTLHFKSKSKMGHYFLKLKLKNSLFKTEEDLLPFSFDADFHNELTINIPVVGVRRGQGVLSNICIETYFPFHLFRCFVYFKPQLDVIIYPEKKDLQIHHAETVREENSYDDNDYILNNYQLGDSLKRVHWKKLAQTNRWYSKIHIAPKLNPIMLSLDLTQIQVLSIEEQLSSLSSALYQLHFQNIKYGLKFNDFLIPPNHSAQQLSRCLKALAVYES